MKQKSSEKNTNKKKERVSVPFCSQKVVKRRDGEGFWKFK